MCIIVLEESHGIEAECSCTVETGGIDHRAGDLLHAVDAVRIRRECGDAFVATQRDGQRQQELHVPPAPALAPDGDACFAARQQQAGLLHRCVAIGDFERDRGVDLRHLARLALDAVAQIEHVEALRLCLAAHRAEGFMG